MKKKYLNKINSPADIKALTIPELCDLCTEIRGFLIESVSKTGGHLSSNLGTVELIVALHKVFETPSDNIVFDVGHQCYTHKIITGRKNQFSELRKLNGISGFPNPNESEHDIFVAGHGNTAISAAIGLARAKKIKDEKGTVIAIVGDGAFTGGMVYEGINNIGTLNNLIVILNDNEMSISKNVGSVAKYLTQIRTSPNYFKAKRDIESILNATPLIGEGIKKGIQNVKSAFRRSLYHSTFFEELGFQYVGPIDGHNLEEMCNLFENLQKQTGPLFIYAVTTKGKGFMPAEKNPGAFHGVSAFDVENVTDPDVSPEGSFSTVMGQKLVKCAKEDSRICAITAAMKYGTGLQFFYRQFPERFFDVGMAEQHAVTFSAGLAKGGMVPVVSIYSTFLQRAYDQIIHDVNLQQLNVLFCIDRAGFVPGDGETHQGIYDVAFLSQLDNFRIACPSNYAELEFWLEKMLAEDKPRAIRYPRGNEDAVLANLGCSKEEFDMPVKTNNAKIAVISYGSEASQALLAVKIANDESIATDMFKLNIVHPLPNGFIEKIYNYNVVIIAEDSVISGSVGQQIGVELVKKGFNGKFLNIAVPNLGITHASIVELRQKFGLDAKSILKVIEEEKA